MNSIKDIQLKRIQKFQKELLNNQLDGFIITKPENIFYFSGFTGSNGLLLFVKNEKILLTDFRYAEQVKKSSHKAIRISVTSRDLFTECINILGSYTTTLRIGIESNHIVVDNFFLLKKKLKNVSFQSMSNVVEQQRAIKDDIELRLIKNAYKMLDGLLPFLTQKAKKGLSELDLSYEAQYFLMKKGAQGASFEPIIITQPRSSMPHAICSKHAIKATDIIMVDIGASLDNYNSDLTRNIVLSRMPKNMQKIYDIVSEAQQAAIQSIHPGMRACEIDAVARNYITKHGFGDYFGHSLGHGIGLEVHEQPYISKSNSKIIQENMVFTIEPGIYLPRRFGVRIEDTVRVTRKGCEVLSNDIN